MRNNIVGFYGDTSTRELCHRVVHQKKVKWGEQKAAEGQKIFEALNLAL